MKAALFSAVVLSVLGGTTAQAPPAPPGCTITNNPVNGLTICNREGRLFAPRTLATSSANNDWNTCRRACAADSRCQSFSFQASRNECKTYGASVITQGFVAGRTGVRFDSKACYTETCVTASVRPSASSTTSSAASSSAAATSTPRPTSTATSVRPSSTSSTASRPASTSASTATPTPPSACPSAVPQTCSLAVSNSYGNNTFAAKYSGNGVKMSPNSPSNNNPTNYPPLTTTYAGTLSVCAAAQRCADYTWSQGQKPLDFRYTFDLHWMKGKAEWECVSYYDPGPNMAADYTVQDTNVCAAYGFSAPYV